jgi:hypothetical protein
MVEDRGSAPRAQRSSVKNPDTFDGSDPSKLRAFLQQCGLVFSSRPQDYPSDSDKIIFMISYLRGSAAEWFEVPPFMDEDAPVPEWDGNYPVFVQELQTAFGPFDPVGDAEDDIRQLRMKHSERITKYVIAFNRLAGIIGWGMLALRHQFYTGLPTRIKDDLVKVDYPNTLLGVRTAAERIDQRYWKREAEKKRENESRAPAGGSSGNANQKDGGKKKSNNQSSTSGNSGSSNNNKPNNAAASSSNSAQRNNSSSSAAGAKPAYADKLDSSGHINEAERERRKKNNLCLYCGKPGHIAQNCRAKASAAGRATTILSPALAAEAKK